MSDYPKEILEAIQAVMKSVAYIKKDGRNEHFKYNYTSEAAVLGHVRAAMLDAGLVLIPSVVDSSTNDKGRTVAKMEFTLAHVSGKVWPEKTAWEGMGQDTQDKGLAKAVTSGMKYFMLKFFQIETGDDPDKDGPIKDEIKPPPQAQKKQTAPKPSKKAIELRALLIEAWENTGSTEGFYEDNLDGVQSLEPWEQERLEELSRGLASGDMIAKDGKITPKPREK